MIWIKKKPLSRRHFLRCSAGGLGAVVTLPALEIMFKSDTAYAQGAGGPPRFVAIYQPNGHKADEFAPDINGAFERNPDLAGFNTSPLQPHMDVTTIFKNFDSSKVGGRGNDHLRAITSWLRGTHTVDDSDEVMVRHTVAPGDKSSADTYLARRYEELYPLPGNRRQHLVIRGSAFFDGGRSGYNNRQKQWVSTAPDGTRIDAEFDLFKLYNDMFAGFDPGMSDDQAQARLSLRKSVLDSVLPEINRLEQKLGASDKQTLQSYFNNIRTIENRLQAQIDAEPDNRQISVPTSNTLILHKGEQNGRDGWYEEPRSYNGKGHNHVDYHWRDTARLLTVALQNETVRSVAYMLESEAGENNYEQGPNGEQGLGDNHGASHQNNAAYGRRDFRHAQVYAEMIDAFKNTQVGNERLIDNTLVVWGAGIGVTHSNNRVMTVMSGLTKPEYDIQHDTLRDMGGDSHKPFFQTVLRKMGALGDTETFGQDNGVNENVDMSS